MVNYIIAIFTYGNVGMPPKVISPTICLYYYVLLINDMLFSNCEQISMKSV